MNREVEASEQHACIGRVVLAGLQERQPSQTAMLPWGRLPGRWGWLLRLVRLAGAGTMVN